MEDNYNWPFEVTFIEHKFDTPALSVARPLTVLFVLDWSADIPVKGKQNEEQRATQIKIRLVMIRLSDAAFILSL